MNNNFGIVFIHGAGLGSYIWEDVKQKVNYPSLAVDFPNRKQGDKANLSLDFNAYSNFIIEQINKWDVKKFILIAHSIGGCVGLKVAEQFENRLVGFMGVGAAIPINGNSFISCLPFPQKIILPLLIKISGTKPPKKAIEEGLCNDLSGDQKERVVNDFTPESKGLYTDRCNVGIPKTKTFYIKLSNDNEFPLSMQDRMAKNLNARKVETIASGHLPMLSQPENLAKTINDCCNELDLHNPK